ncbi:monovalent cation/H+ antiporter subunit D family protein [Corynebacterium massiliense]|uniref:monovalent cation/H+ antiporter subunit D family protein n=1 Tax=Corynebacterium massiliense TaxID=441501 RepID=UPI0023531C65|nr:monovalent cation/H+ antiporter subunit D family protein [Corynebacterium massiliense]
MPLGIDIDLVSLLLPLFVGVPLLGAGLTIIFRKAMWFQHVVLFAILGAALAASIGLIFLTQDGSAISSRLGEWGSLVGIPFAADMFSALMLTTTALLAVVCAWFAAASGYSREPFFVPLTLVLMTGVFGTLLTADIFNFFVFIEVMLVPSYGLYAMTIYRRGGDLQLGGMRLFITANLLASTMLLTGVGLVYGTYGAVNLGQLYGAAKEDPATAVAMSIAMLAMLIKASVVPIHSWLARSYPYTSPAVTALFSGLHTKVGVYALYRWYSIIYDGDARWLWILVLLFTLTMVIGVFGAVGEKTTREILTFHMVSQLGYILMGVALFTQLGMTAGIFYLVHHMIVKASLFMSTGAVEVKYGTGELGKITNISKREPMMAVAFFAAALSLAGIPPFSGFVAKFSLLLGTWQAGQAYAFFAMIVVSLITLLSMLKIWKGMFWGDRTLPATAPRQDQDPDGPNATLGGGVASYPETPADQAANDAPVGSATRVVTQERYEDEAYVIENTADAKPRVGFWLGAPAAITALLTLAIGLGAEVLLRWAGVAADGLMDPTTYLEAVMQ